MNTEPQKEHQWLSQLVGEWTYESEASMGPDQPPGKFSGKETVRSLGGLWAICEGEGDAPGGGTSQMIITLGYDPAKQRFVGTFVGSSMASMWLYEGQLDESGKVLTLDTEGMSFTDDGGTSKYQDVVEILSEDHRTLSSRVLGDDGQWTQFMTAHYHRVR